MRDVFLGGFTIVLLFSIFFGSYKYAVHAGIWPTWAPGGAVTAPSPAQ